MMRLLPLAVLLLGSPAAAQDRAAFAQQAQRCSELGGEALCRAALDQSHRLKNWAEARKLWRCYSAVLAAEAEMIAASFASGQSVAVATVWQEMATSCRP